MTARSCTHGMPTPASCVDCMFDGPVAPPTPDAAQILGAVRWIEARIEGGRCARCHDTVTVGSMVGLVVAPPVGWCCVGCAR